MDWISAIVGTGLSLYGKKQAEKQSAKEAQMQFQLQKQQLAAQTAQANAAAAAANANAAAARSTASAPNTGSLPGWVLPAGLGVAALGVLALTFRSSRA